MNQQLAEVVIVTVGVLVLAGMYIWGSVVKQDHLVQAMNNAAKKPIELHAQLLAREDLGVKNLAIISDLVTTVGDQLAHMREVGVPVITRPNGRHDDVSATGRNTETVAR
jgi:hypothetical protein